MGGARSKQLRKVTACTVRWLGWPAAATGRIMTHAPAQFVDDGSHLLSAAAPCSKTAASKTARHGSLIVAESDRQGQHMSLGTAKQCYSSPGAHLAPGQTVER